MGRKARIELIATTAGIVALCLVVTALAAWISTDNDYLKGAAVGSAIATTVALGVWSNLFGKNRKIDLFLKRASPGDWLGIFFGSFFISVFCLLIDCGGRLPQFHPRFVCDGHPGISAFFTIGALCMTAIAIPSALRAWILKKYGATGLTASEP